MSESSREKIGFFQFMEKYPDEAAARQQLEEWRWNGRIRCPYCDSLRVSKTKSSIPYRCKDCRDRFNIRTHTVMAFNKMPLRKWLAAIYMASTGLEGMASVKLATDVGTSYKAAWRLSHRLRKVWETDGDMLSGEAEADETRIGENE